jgi:hypothetical protein
MALPELERRLAQQIAIRYVLVASITSAVGHKSFATTQSYIREAQSLHEGFGDVFPALPARLRESRRVIRKRSASSQVGEITVPKEGLEPSHPCE